MFKISDQEYRGMEALSQSDLAYILKSPLHFLRRNELRRETEAMRFGTAFHMAVLEPQKFKDLYVLEPSTMPNGEPINKRKKADKEYLEQFKMDNMDKVVIDGEDMECLTGMLNAISSHPVASKLFSGGESEVSNVWEYRGRQCKGRADYLFDSHPELGRAVIELKTAQDASPMEFTRVIYNKCYDFQAYWYKNGFQANHHVVVAVEKTFPFAIGVYNMVNWMEHGQKRVDRAMDKLDYAEANNEWSGYTEGIEPILPANWVISKEGEE